jgi:hypothetical protein
MSDKKKKQFFTDAMIVIKIIIKSRYFSKHWAARRTLESLIKDPEQKKELRGSVLFLKETYNFYHKIRILKQFYQRPIKITFRLGSFYYKCDWS